MSPAELDARPLQGGFMADRLRKFLATVALAWALYSLVRLVQGHLPLAALQGLVAVLTGFLWLGTVRTADPRRLQALAQAAMAATLLGLVLLSLGTGQGNALALWFLPAVPLFIAYIASPQVAMGWLLATLAALLLVHGSSAVVEIPPLARFAGRELLLGQVVLVLVVHALSVAFSRTTSSHLRALEAQAAELAAARDEALRAAAARSQFLANMSHEIRTPLNGVVGVTQLLQETVLDGEQRRLVETLNRSGLLLRTVVDDILDFSKLDSQAVSLERVPFDPAQAVRDVADLFRPTAEERGVALETELDLEGPEAVLGDGMRYRQVLTNLVSNAVKFTTRGAVRISLAFPEGLMRTEVRDSGIGIPADRIQQLFEPFQQADVSTTRLYGGTGLGLAIARALVERMGGRLEVESEAGRGSTFFFSLPCEPAEGVGARALPPTLSAALAGEIPLRILLAEDNPVNREVAVGMLERLGYRPEVAADGVEAVTAARAGHFDLVLMDLHMPRMDGLEATRQILGRGWSGPRNPPRVVALTADVIPERRAALLEAGISSFLAKPLVARDLVDLLRSFGMGEGPGEVAEPLIGDAFARLRQLYAARPEKLGALVDTHRAHARRLVGDMQAALEEGDASTLERAAHSLKSSAAMFGSEGLSALSARVEAAARAGDLEEARRASLEFPDALERAEAGLAAAMASGG